MEYQLLEGGGCAGARRCFGPSPRWPSKGCKLAQIVKEIHAPEGVGLAAGGDDDDDEVFGRS
jgi:hypothetical protein